MNKAGQAQMRLEEVEGALVGSGGSPRHLPHQKSQTGPGF